MKRSLLIGFVLVGILSVWLVPRVFRPVSGLTAPAEAPHIGEGGLPQFERDPVWPKLPATWKMGYVSAVAADADDHIWLLHRPRTLALAHPGLTSAVVAAPPVLEFDNEGNFIQAWGGESGPGYQWPSNEHAIMVDYKGFVWILGKQDGVTGLSLARPNGATNSADLPNDNQILKFTKSGKFVMAIGKSGQVGSNATEVLRGATGLRVYPKTNELFVSDGYGNSRVMVYDADTGKFKRMWGAYGDKPLDMEARPPRSKPSALPWIALAEVLQQFGSPVHDVDVSNDGLVYVSDRGNKRVQVFTPEGKFVAEQFVALDSRWDFQARSTAFSPDQRFLYVGGTPVIYILNRKTLEVLGSFVTGTTQDQPGNQIAADHKGNIYELTGAFESSGGTGANKFVFKGYSLATQCCQGGGVRASN